MGSTPPVRPSMPPSAPSRPGASRTSRDDAHEVKVPQVPADGMLKVLTAVIHFAVRIMAVLMVLVILGASPMSATSSTSVWWSRRS